MYDDRMTPPSTTLQPGRRIPMCLAPAFAGDTKAMSINYLKSVYNVNFGQKCIEAHVLTLSIIRYFNFFIKHMVNEFCDIGKLSLFGALVTKSNCVYMYFVLLSLYAIIKRNRLCSHYDKEKMLMSRLPLI